jgi:starvation-inducible outer membrane lipoprotein
MCKHQQKQLTGKEINSLMLTYTMCITIGKEISNQDVAVEYTLHDVTSGNGPKLIQLAQIHGMFVVSTKYKHKKIHKGTRIIPGKMEINQIDQVLINKRRLPLN